MQYACILQRGDGWLPFLWSPLRLSPSFTAERGASPLRSADQGLAKASEPPGRRRVLPRPDLCELQLQTRKLRAGFQHLNSIETFGIAVSGPNFYGLLMGDEQPAEPGTVGLI